MQLRPPSVLSTLVAFSALPLAQEGVDAFVATMFDKLVTAVGAEYGSRPRDMVAHLCELFTDGALPTACPVMCICPEDASGCRPHALARCGHVVCSYALQRPATRDKRPATCSACPRCGAPCMTAATGALPTATFKRANPMRLARARPVKLPHIVDAAHVHVGAALPLGHHGHTADVAWAPSGD